MADWVVVLMSGPYGFVYMTVAAIIALFMWWLFLGSRYSQVGIRPLLIGLGLAAAGILLISGILCYMHFNERVASGLMADTDRLKTMLRWTGYTTLITIFICMPALMMLGVPAAALMLRSGHFSIGMVLAVLIAGWVVFSLIGWTTTSTQWRQMSMFYSLSISMKNTFLYVAFIAAPFLLGVRTAAAR